MEVGQRTAVDSPPSLSPIDRSGTALGHLAQLLALRPELKFHEHAVDSYRTKCCNVHSTGYSS